MATESIERGFIYQKIHFWLQAVKLFDETELVNRVVIESSDIKHLDDIVVYYHPSGIADGSQQILVDAIQVKHHDDHRTQYSIDNLIDKQLISKDSSLLQQLFTGYQSIIKTGIDTDSIRVHLVSTWIPDDSLGKCITTDGRLVSQFIHNESGFKQRYQKWLKHLGGTEVLFQNFLSSLRLHLSQESFDVKVRELNKELQRLGFKPVNISQRIEPYTNLVTAFLTRNENEWNANTLMKELEKADLIADKTTLLRRVTFGVCSFSKKDEDLQRETIRFLDLRNHFDGRQLKTEHNWSEIETEINKFLSRPEYRTEDHFVRLDCTYSLAFLIGRYANTVSGTKLFPLQSGDPWKPTVFKSLNAPIVVETPRNETSNDIALLLNFTRDATTEVVDFLELSKLQVKSLVAISPSQGVGQSVVSSADEASAYADFISHWISQQRDCTIHLFPVLPISILFFLGQRHRFQNPRLSIYEYEIDEDRRYHCGVNFPITLQSSQEKS